MKKVVSAIFAIVILLSSCSKEKKLNKKLDGEWNITSYDGVSLASGETEVISFDKDKKEGSYTWTYTDASGSDVETGTYTLTDDKAITFKSTSLGVDYPATIEEYSKTKLKLTVLGEVIEATKK